MKTVQKFFDEKNRETTPDKASVMIEQTLDEDGSVMKESIFLRSEEDVVPKSKPKKR